MTDVSSGSAKSLLISRKNACTCCDWCDNAPGSIEEADAIVGSRVIRDVGDFRCVKARSPGRDWRGGRDYGCESDAGERGCHFDNKQQFVFVKDSVILADLE